MKSIEEHRFTSTGVKFWRHREAMDNYRSDIRHTVISTHISPEGVCNLKCPYCSVTHRKVHNRIDLAVIKQYVRDLYRRGLKAVILTGGGEPTIYPQFNELVRWLKKCEFSVALITNGTQTRRVDPDVWRMFSWVRCSINLFDGWEEKIKLPPRSVFDESCIIGSSFVFTQKHEAPEDVDADLLARVAAVARSNYARYVRLLPNCLLPQASLAESHAALDALLARVGDTIFFHQHKNHAAPQCSKCHQSHFRPYLSEVPFRGTGVPGSVYPCDSVVLNNENAQFIEKYQLCVPGDVLKHIDGELTQPFDAKTDCAGCVFTDNVNMLDDWKERGIDKFGEFTGHLEHEEFV